MRKVARIAAALIASTASAAAQGSPAIVDIPISLKLTGTGSTLSWTLVPDPAAIERVGILREGDTVTVLMTDASEMTLARSRVTYKYLKHRRCRTSWFRKKCTLTYANTPCLTPIADNPLTGDVDTKVTFARDGVPTADARMPDLDIEFGDGTAQHRFVSDLPLRLAISGGVKHPLPKCNRSMPGKPTHNDPRLHGNPVGKNQPVRWFTIRVVVDEHPLDN